jgi:Clp amino terminal domain, pathogenicity island component
MQVSTTLDGMPPLDATLVGEARTSRDRLLEAQHELERARADYNHAVRRLHAEGASLREIAEELGLSHQRIHQIVEGGEGGPVRRGPRHAVGWPFERFTRRARQIVVLAQEEAEVLGHGRVGTEHLLLGLLRAEDEAVSQILGETGVTLERVRERVGALESTARRGRRISFTRAAKRVLEHSLREARALGDNFIGAKHVLLGLLADERAGSLRILVELGADPEALRAAVQASRRDG